MDSRGLGLESMLDFFVFCGTIYAFFALLVRDVAGALVEVLAEALARVLAGALPKSSCVCPS